ncbi:MAG: potassium channel family protein [Tepidisphaeraceae bacterium]|jgi:hypothetical protein
MSWTLRGDLELFGIHLPDTLPIDDWAAKLTGHPCTNSATLVVLSAIAFLKAEKGHNPKVNDIYDALVYTSTCLSVGYGDIFARTSAGKVIGTALMTIGPALAARTLDGPAAHPTDDVHAEILATLKQILAKLDKESEPAA